MGARCAGSPLAAMLARRGLRVCLLDRSQFPSETLSTHVIQPCGVAVLDRLGVLDTVFAAGAVPLTRLTAVAEEARLDTEFSPRGVRRAGAERTPDHARPPARGGGGVCRGRRAHRDPGDRPPPRGRASRRCRDRGRRASRSTRGRRGRPALDGGRPGRRHQVPPGASRPDVRLGVLRGSGRPRRQLALRPAGRFGVRRQSNRRRALHGRGLSFGGRQGRLPRRPRAQLHGGTRHVARTGRPVDRGEPDRPDPGDDRLARLLPGGGRAGMGAVG